MANAAERGNSDSFPRTIIWTYALREFKDGSPSSTETQQGKKKKVNFEVINGYL